MKFKCGKCKKDFENHPSSKSKYCSQECFHKSRIGVKRPEHGKKMSGEGNGRWKGGKLVDKDGYFLILASQHPHRNGGGYVREHRLVMEKHIGRYLKHGEVVHHKNEDKQDNRIGNLELLTKEEHDKHHRTSLIKSRCKK